MPAEDKEEPVGKKKAERGRTLDEEATKVRCVARAMEQVWELAIERSRTKSEPCGYG